MNEFISSPGRLISPPKYFTCGGFCFHDCGLKNTKPLHESMSPTLETRRKRGTHLRACLSLPVRITLLSMFLVCSVCLSTALLRSDWFHKFLSLGLKLGLRHTQGWRQKEICLDFTVLPMKLLCWAVAISFCDDLLLTTVACVLAFLLTDFSVSAMSPVVWLGQKYSIVSLISNEHVLSAGFEIDTPDTFGRTCLHAAAAGGWVPSGRLSTTWWPRASWVT